MVVARLFKALALCVLVACGRPEGEGALFRAASLAGPAELEVHGLAVPLAGPVCSPSLCTGGGRGPRVVVAHPASDAAARWLAHLGAEATDAGFRYLDQDFAWVSDVLVAVFEDPEREGLPLTVVLGDGAANLAPLSGRLGVGSVPSLQVLREGGRVFEARLTQEGRPRPASVREHRPSWPYDPAAYQRVEAPGLVAQASRGLPVEGVNDYLARVGAARERALAWAAPAAGAPATADLVLEVGLDELPRGFPADRLARCVRAAAGERGAQVHGLLVVPREGSDHPRLDDGGAALVEDDLRARLGPPVEAWMAEAAAVEAAGTWFGLELEEWARVLVPAGLRPGLAELLAGDACARTSPHAIVPLRALLLRTLRLELGEGLAEVWRGERARPEDVRLERLWLDLLGEAVGGLPTAEVPQLAGQLFGVRLGAEVGSVERGVGSRASRLALNDLSVAGGQAVLLDAFVALEPGLGDGRGLEAEPRIRALGGDAAFCLAAADARARDLRSVLCAHLLTTPEGTFSAGLKRTRVEEVERLFEEVRTFAVHAALLARCAGVDLLALGGEGTSALADCRLDVEPRPGEAAVEAELRRARHAGWQRTLTGLRQLGGRPLTFVAPDLPMAERFAFWSELDALALPFRPEAGGEAFGPGTRGPVPDARTRARMRGRLSAVADLAETVGRPWLLVGVGFRATSGAWRGEFGGALGELDVAEQQRLWRSFGWAYHQAVGEGRGPDGLVVDRWEVDLFAPGATRSYDVRGKGDLWPLLKGLWRP